MHRALVSGVTGHLGKELARQLVSSRIEVHGLTRQDTAQASSQIDNVQLHQVDSRTETLISILEETRPDTVFHLAGISRREHLSSDVIPFVESNILFGTQLLEAMKRTACRRFITAGTYLQHFDTEGYRALNLYAATKQAFEDVLSFYVDAFRFNAARLTLGDIYSEADSRPKLMKDIATAWERDTALCIHDAEAHIDPVHVEDAAAAFLKVNTLFEAPSFSTNSILRYSVSSGKGISVMELVGLFEKIGGRRLALQYKEPVVAGRRIKPWRGMPVPGWTPDVTIENGISRIISRRQRTTD